MCKPLLLALPALGEDVLAYGSYAGTGDSSTRYDERYIGSFVNLRAAPPSRANLHSQENELIIDGWEATVSTLEERLAKKEAQHHGSWRGGSAPYYQDVIVPVAQ